MIKRQITIHCGICGERKLPAFTVIGGMIPPSATVCPQHPHLMGTSVVSVDDSNVLLDVSVSETQMVDKWEKEFAEERKQLAIQERQDAERDFRERCHQAFFDATPNVTEQDFERAYPELRAQIIKEQTRAILEGRIEDAADIWSGYFKKVQERTKK